MTAVRPLQRVLADEGIADLTGMWSPARIESWNRRLDGHFDATVDQPRSYAGADDLARLGIVDELFTTALCRLIAGIQPSALLYHCHCYEIAARQEQPHIHAGLLQGWHRDTETLSDHTPNFPMFISIFVLLSPVGADDGPFEFSPRPPTAGLRPHGDIVRLTGPVGTAAIWNRSYFHRASPNRGPIRRRILKLSFQPAGLPNDRIALDEFAAAAALVDNQEAAALFDAARLGSATPLPYADTSPTGRPVAPSATNDLTWRAIVTDRTNSGVRRLVSMTRGG